MHAGAKVAEGLGGVNETARRDHCKSSLIRAGWLVEVPGAKEELYYRAFPSC